MTRRRQPQARRVATRHGAARPVPLTLEGVGRQIHSVLRTGEPPRPVNGPAGHPYLRHRRREPVQAAVITAQRPRHHCRTRAGARAPTGTGGGEDGGGGGGGGGGGSEGGGAGGGLVERVFDR